jgi:hypothetical protein
MTTPDEQKIRALTFALSQRLDAASVAQDALMAEQSRQGLPVTPAFHTADEMAAVQAASWVEIREMGRAVIADTRYRYDPTYKPDALHAMLIGLGRSLREGSKTNVNVIPMRTNEAAARRRRDET